MVRKPIACAQGAKHFLFTENLVFQLRKKSLHVRIRTKIFWLKRLMLCQLSYPEKNLANTIHPKNLADYGLKSELAQQNKSLVMQFQKNKRFIHKYTLAYLIQKVPVSNPRLNAFCLK